MSGEMGKQRGERVPSHAETAERTDDARLEKTIDEIGKPPANGVIFTGSITLEEGQNLFDVQSSSARGKEYSSKIERRFPEGTVVVITPEPGDTQEHMLSALKKAIDANPDSKIVFNGPLLLDEVIKEPWKDMEGIEGISNLRGHPANIRSNIVNFLQFFSG